MGKKLDYGRGHPDFLEYVEEIVRHPAYEGMPDVYIGDGSIQWETASNRGGGKFQFSHRDRGRWWYRKAQELGVETNTPHWISRVAKAIHPFGKKPCKRCGRVLEIRRAYPNKLLMSRIRGLSYADDSFTLDPLEHIQDLIARMVDHYGDQVFVDLPHVLKTGKMKIPTLEPELEVWARWIEEVYIPSNPSTLSPGVMSDAPDRLDGFHSLNRCCREGTDPGRSKENMASYVTDRRAFEFWVDGDWIAADRLYGLVKSWPELEEERCLFGHPPPLSVDHIGPISLGCNHRPDFQLLCSPCNSAKGNRWFLSDVAHLRDVEAAGERVMSWHSQALWDLRKGDVTNQEMALRLSKLLRDNRHNAMYILDKVAKAGHLTFLATLLSLADADRNVKFVNLRFEGHRTRFDGIKETVRRTKQAQKQKVRRLRVAFNVLGEYVAKDNRNAFIVIDSEIGAEVEAAIRTLEQSPVEVVQLDREIAAALDDDRGRSDERLKDLVDRIPLRTDVPHAFVRAMEYLEAAMSLVARRLSGMWDDDRYVRIMSTDAATDDSATI